MRIPRIRFSGYQRLGIVLSVYWLVFVPIIYFIGIATYPSPITTAFHRFYIWVPGSKPAGPGEVGHDIGFIPDVPLADGLALGSLFYQCYSDGSFFLYCRVLSDGFEMVFSMTSTPPNTALEPTATAPTVLTMI